MTLKLPRLPLYWRDQPQLFERYWDDVLRNLEQNVTKTDGIVVDLDQVNTSINSLNSSVSSLALSVADVTARVGVLESRTSVLISSQPAGTVFAAPAGSAGLPGFRPIAVSDVPTLNQNTTGNAANVTGTVAISNGGTGATTAATARANLGLATVASSGSFADLNTKPGIQSNGQNVISANKTLGLADKGTNILIVTSGITVTFPSSGYSSGEGVAVSNVSGGNVTLAFPGGSDMGTTLPNNGTFFAFCDGGGFWRQYCYSTTRL